MFLCQVECIKYQVLSIFISCLDTQTLKAIALLRMGRQEESLALIGEVRGAHPGDQATLQACTMYFREMGDCEFKMSEGSVFYVGISLVMLRTVVVLLLMWHMLFLQLCTVILSVL